MLLGAILLVLVQAELGMVVNLYVIVPAHHPGAHPANYFAGSLHSVTWAISHSPIPLALHAALGLALGGGRDRHRRSRRTITTTRPGLPSRRREAAVVLVPRGGRPR